MEKIIKSLIIIGLLIFQNSAFSQVVKNLTVVEDNGDVTLVDIDQFKERALINLNNLQDYLTILASKDKDDIEAQAYYLEETLKFFIRKGKGVIMEVSSINTSKKKSIPLLSYLKRLIRLSYTKVIMKKAETCRVSNLRSTGTDNNGNTIYTGVATFYQIFIGYNGDGIAYQDKTEKNIEIIAKKIKGVYGENWVVKFGDISVSSTDNL